MYKKENTSDQLRYRDMALADLLLSQFVLMLRSAKCLIFTERYR